VKMRGWLGLLGLSVTVFGSGGCWRTDVYAITEADAGPSWSCPWPALKPGNSSLTLQVDGVIRSYILHVPPAYDGSRPVPLIVDFHGINGTSASQMTNSPYPAVTDAEGVVMAFPEGLIGPIGTAWNFGPCCIANVDDLGFARALVAHIRESACIDPDRVYAVGVLTGGGMVYHLACNAADVFAAVAPAAFDLTEETKAVCHPSRAIAVLSFRGTADSRVPYEGGASTLVPGMGITFLGAKATFETWAALDRCTGSPSPEDRHGCSTYASCQDGVEVALCTKQGGREEPGDATIAWPWLKRFTRFTR